MKKRLFFSFVALLCAICSFAQHQDGEYVYTSNARYKLIGNNVMSEAVGTFTQDDGFGGWALIDGAADYSEFAEVGSGLRWTNSLATNGIVSTVDVTAPGLYIVMFKMYNEDNAFTTAANIAAKNGVQIVANMEGGASTTNADESATEKSSGTFTVETSENEYFLMMNIQNPWNTKLNIVLSGLLENTLITGIEVWQAQQVWDIRALNKYLEDANLYMTDSEFSDFQENTEALAKLQETVQGIQDLLDNPDTQSMFDDESTGEDAKAMLSEAIDEYFEATAIDVSDLFKTTANGKNYVGFDFANWEFLSRGKLAPTGPNMNLQSGNWGHLNTTEASTAYPDPTALTSRIQNNQPKNASAFNIFHQDFPQGKYFFTAELRASSTSKDSWPCKPDFANESLCQYFINNDVRDITIGGNNWTKVVIVSETPDDEMFHAGVFWSGPNSDCTMEIVPNQGTVNITQASGNAGGVFDIRNVKVRAFNTDMRTDVERKAYYSAFKAQYDAIVAAREAALEMQKDVTTYPYRQDSLAAAFTQWDPYYNQMINGGWVGTEGEDTKVATDEQLQNFVKFQGVWATPEDTVGVANYTDYPVSRGYQNATAYVKNAIAHFTTLAQTISTAKSVRDDAMNVSGDKATFDEAIAAAQKIYDDTYAAANVGSYVADSTTVMSANETLLAAIDAFKESAKLENFLEFRFDADADGNAVYTTIYGDPDPDTGDPTVAGYEIAATTGDFKMTFANAGAFSATTTGGTYFQLGSANLNDVLRVGNSEAKIDFSGAGLTADEVLRVEFDLWGGKLTGKSVYAGIRNAEGDCLGGFKFRPYDANVSQNDFTDGTIGIDLKTQSKIGAIGSSSEQNDKIHANGALNHFVLVYDVKAQTIVGELYAKGATSPTSGDVSGATLPMVANENGDYLPAVFYVGSDYNNADRRCWFDNLTMVKYKSSADVTGIREVTPVNAETLNGNLYNIAGQAVSDSFKGVVIQNSKKFIK